MCVFIAIIYLQALGHPALHDEGDKYTCQYNMGQGSDLKQDSLQNCPNRK
jgi:hypothetical protein